MPISHSISCESALGIGPLKNQAGAMGADAISVPENRMGIRILWHAFIAAQAAKWK